MTVYLAIGYTVQQGVLSQLPESFITADQYRQLDIPGKQQAWKDFLLGDGSQPVWQESYQTGVSNTMIGLIPGFAALALLAASAILIVLILKREGIEIN